MAADAAPDRSATSVQIAPAPFATEEHAAPDAPPCGIRNHETQDWLTPEHPARRKDGTWSRCHIKANPITYAVQPPVPAQKQ